MKKRKVGGVRYEARSYADVTDSHNTMTNRPPPEKKGKLGAYAMKRVAAGAYLPTPWLFEPAKRPDDRAYECLD